MQLARSHCLCCCNACSAHAPPQSWVQDYTVNVTYACGQTGIETWTADLMVTDVLTTQSQYLVEYNPCSIIPLPPITDTCRCSMGVLWGITVCNSLAAAFCTCR